MRRASSSFPIRLYGTRRAEGDNCYSHIAGNLIAIQAFISDLHPTSAERSDGRKFLDCEADSLRCGGELTITCRRAPGNFLNIKKNATEAAGAVISADIRRFPFQVFWSCQRVKLSHCFNDAQSELFDSIFRKSDPLQSQQMPGAVEPPPPSACAVYVRTRPQRGLAGVFAFAAPEAGTSPMTLLAHRLEKISWIFLGQMAK